MRPVARGLRVFEASSTLSTTGLVLLAACGGPKGSLAPEPEACIGPLSAYVFNRGKVPIEVYDGDALHIGSVAPLSSARFSLVHARYARIAPTRNSVGVWDYRIRYECDS